MANLIEVKEPYVRVSEKIVSTSLNPTAGEDLIIGCSLIADSGPAIALVRDQKEFLEYFSSQPITKEYLNSIDSLYEGDDKNLASTMWLNAYRLSGSCNLLVVRATKGKDLYFSKPLSKGAENAAFIVKDGQLLKKVPEFKLVVDVDKDSSAHSTDGWSISINGIGVLGNRNTDSGAQYDYYVGDIQELVNYLNDTPVFFSPSYTLYADEKGTVPTTDPSQAVSVVFNEVYLGNDILDTTDTRCPGGLAYVVACEPDWTIDNPDQKVVDLNGAAYSKFTPAPFYASNKFNSSTDLKVRIRRFNHDAVTSRELSKGDVNIGGNSPWNVLSGVLDTFTANGTKTPGENVVARDFYEVAVFDPSLSREPLYFNVGNISGRGDINVATLNETLKMIQLELPEDLSDLGLDYYGYLSPTKKTGWAKLTSPNPEQTGRARKYGVKSELDAVESPSVDDVAVIGKVDAEYYKYQGGEWVTIGPSEATLTGAKYSVSTLTTLKSQVLTPAEGEIAKVGKEAGGVYYIYKKGITLQEVADEEIHVDLSIDPSKYKILSVNDSDLLRAFGELSEDEVYVTEGLTDLGCTSPAVQSYMANMAINENYFFPVSTVNSTNYLAIANGIRRISQDSHKLYVAAPWDIDTSTVGFKFFVSPSVLYWESVARNKRNDREFAPVFGQTNGVAQYQKPVAEFNKKTRQLLLSRKINTPIWNITTSAWNWNDNFTKTSENNIMSDESNSRLQVRISKAMPALLNQFKGRHINSALWSAAHSVIDYWFKSNIMKLEYRPSDYRITIDESNNPSEVQRKNQMKVLIEVRYQRALKYVEVANFAYDVGVPFGGTTAE